MGKKKSYDYSDVASIVAAVESALPTVRVKTASASRAGNKIQTRVTWLEEDGRIQLGYIALPIISGKLGTLQPITLIEQAMRLKDRALAAADNATNLAVRNTDKLSSFNQTIDIQQYGYELLNEVRDALTADPSTLVPLIPVCNEITAKMKKVFRDGGHHTARRARNKKRARAALAFTLDYVLASGISDDEIRDMLKESIVRHTMDS